MASTTSINLPMKSLYRSLFALLFAFTVQVAHGQVPQLINFQANIDGLEESSAAVIFEIYDAPTNGVRLWFEVYSSLPVTNGRIQALLGSQSDSPLSPAIFQDGDRYIQITVNGEVLNPRTQLTSVAYAMRAAVADSLSISTPVVTSFNDLSGDVSISAGENIVITPDGQNLRIDATAVTTSGGVSSLNSLTGPVALEEGANVTITPSGQNLIIDSQGDGVGVASLNSLSGSISLLEGNNIDIVTEGQNLRISASSSVGVGPELTLGPAGSLEIKTESNNDAITMGDFFNIGGSITAHTSNGGMGAQIWGILTGDDSETGDPLRGGSLATFKEAGGGNDGTVWIRSNGFSETNAWGVMSIRNSSGNNSIFMNGKDGNLSITGNLAKGSGSFKIDHPLDPTNKYLSHSFVESPDMMNVYNGNILLDEAGEAWVELPEWFESLNTDFRYQLTCVGGYAPVYIAEKIEDNKFKIAGGIEGLEISWQVTGIRNDPYAKLNRIQVEEEKEDHERGTYMHPKAYQQNQ